MNLDNDCFNYNLLVDNKKEINFYINFRNDEFKKPLIIMRAQIPMKIKLTMTYIMSQEKAQI